MTRPTLTSTRPSLTDEDAAELRALRVARDQSSARIEKLRAENYALRASVEQAQTALRDDRDEQLKALTERVQQLELDMDSIRRWGSPRPRQR
jgi:hypothetical protein